MIYDLRDIGRICKQFRKECGYLQSDVARATGYSTELISSFETGRVNNLSVFLWYLRQGLTIEDIEEGL